MEQYGELALETLRGIGLRVLAASVVTLMIAIVVQVMCSALDINPIASFETDQPILGNAITLNSMLDFQWHLLVMVGLLPVGLVWALGKHVRVDFIYNKFSDRTKARVNFAGNLLFAAPFFFLMLPAAWNFMMRAWSSDEGSASGGLNDLWLIKAVLPLGLGLLALAILIETVRLLRHIR